MARTSRTPCRSRRWMATRVENLHKDGGSQLSTPPVPRPTPEPDPRAGRQPRRAGSEGGTGDQDPRSTAGLPPPRRGAYRLRQRDSCVPARLEEFQFGGADFAEDCVGQKWRSGYDRLRDALAVSLPSAAHSRLRRHYETSSSSRALGAACAGAAALILAYPTRLHFSHSSARGASPERGKTLPTRRPTPLATQVGDYLVQDTSLARPSRNSTHASPLLGKGV